MSIQAILISAGENTLSKDLLVADNWRSYEARDSFGIEIAIQYYNANSRKEKTMKHKHAFMLLLIFSFTFAICLSVYADDTTIYGCYKKVNGQLRIVGKGSKCLPSESSISWNQVGPPGPAGGSSMSASLTTRQIGPGVCTNYYGWCPDGYKWAFKISDAIVSGNSVIAINVNPSNPSTVDYYGCEVVRMIAGEFQIMCAGEAYVPGDAILQYAVFNP